MDKRLKSYFRLGFALIIFSSFSATATDQPYTFDMAAQPLTDALLEFSDITGIKIFFGADSVRSFNTSPIAGQYTAAEALDKLLASSDLHYGFSRPDMVTISRPQASNLTVAELLAQAPQQDYPAEQPLSATGPIEQTDLEVVGVPMDGYAAIRASTATKTDTPIIETPMSVQVVPQTVLRDQQAFRLQDAVKNVSGVQQRFSGGGFDRFVVRGFDVGELYYRNGVRIPRINSDLANVQQIEVLKGPASGLFGRIEPGGLINTVTKRAETEAKYAVEQRFGSYDYYRTQLDATGPLLSDEQLSYRFDLSYLNSDSFREFSSSDRVFVAPALTWKPSQDTELNLSLEYLNEDRVYDSGLPAIGDHIANVPITRQIDQPGLQDNHEYWLVDFNWSHRIDNHWQIRNGVVALEYFQNYQETYANALLADNRTVERRTWFGDPDTNKLEAQTVFLDINGQFKTYGIEHNVLFGGDYYYAKSFDSATVQTLDTIDLFNPVFPQIDIQALASAPRRFNYVETNEWFGIYFQDQMTFWDTLHIMGGGRYDIATNGNGYSNSSLTAAEAAFDDIEQNQFSPRFGILYRPWQWFSVYGNFVESFGPSNGRSATGEPFKPQTATQYEAGVKTEWWDGRLSTNLVYYHLTKENTLTTDPNNPSLSVAIGEARSQGLEFDMTGQITDGLSMIGTYAWTDARITKDNSGNEGKRLPYVPLHSGSLWLKYDFNYGELDGLSLGAGIYAASKRFGDAANSFYDSAYARLDLLAAYRFQAGRTRITTQLNINNVTDTVYYLSRSRVYNQPADPFTVLGSIRLEY